MKKLLLLTVMLTALGASLALAQGGVSLTYTNCNVAGNIDRTYPCDVDPPTTPLILAFHLDADLPDFVGVDALVGIATAEGVAVPDWWNVASGQCRESAVSPVNVATTTGCTNPYAGTVGQGGGLDGSQLIYDNQVNHRRFAVSWARAETFAVTANTKYVGAKINIEGTAADACAGCAQPACLVAQLVKAFGQGGAKISVTQAGAGDNQFITWAGGAVGGSGCPAETPARNRTWGGVKALYR